jgi:hypothetical protein
MPKRRGRPSAAQTPAPNSDKISGSSKNKVGSATNEGSSKINLSNKTINSLKEKLENFKKDNPSKKNIDLNDLKAVYRRGSGAYSKSHRPTITGGAPNSRAAWSYARVNKFLKKASGEKVKAAYVQDDDLMAKGGLIAPNGNNSNLTPEQYKLVRTPQFKAWFGDWENDPKNASKVVDENGEPLVVYRGDVGKFNVFEPKNHQYGKFWFSDNYAVAKTYGNVREYFLSIRKLYKNVSVKVDERYENVGIILTDVYDPAYDEGDVDLIANNYIVFHSSQIKLADGTNTIFNAENHDIRYEDGGDLGQEITCMGCGWRWNTNQSDASDKYVCHKCWFDNRIYYDSEPIGLADGGYTYPSIPSHLSRVYNSRLKIPNVRGGWTKEKIIKYLKDNSSDTISTFRLTKYISEFDDWEQFKNHIYYHGTHGYIEKGLKPSITMSEREVERIGGGGYGQRYFGVSLTKRKRTAESFSGMSSGVTIYPVILKRDANVIERTDLKDSSEIDDIIVELYEKGIDAVWIGGGEEELVVINPYSILLYTYGKEYHSVYGGFKSIPLTDEEIKKIYNNSKILWAKYSEEYKSKQNQEEKQIFLKSLPNIQFEKGGLIAPNGKPSNLTPEQYKLVRTPEFIAWFGDWENDPANASKVVDENGEPMVVYHGTNNDFTIFKLEKPTIAAYGQGFYFTNDKKFASNYARGENSKILSLFLKIIKVFDIYEDEFPKEYEKYSEMSNNKGLSRDFTNKLVSQGYDGVYAKNKYNENELVVFQPNQIKLADGTNTTFDAENPDIRYADGGKTPELKVVLIEDGSLLENEAYDIVSNEIGATGMARLGLLENNKLVGAVYIEPPSEYDLNGVHTIEPLYEYKFDIFIKRNKRNKGYSKLLLDSMIKDYVENFDDNCDQIRAEVINEKLRKSLEKNYDFLCDSGNEENITYCYLQREDAKKLYNMKMKDPIKAAKGKKIEAKGDCYYIAGQFAMHKMFAPAQIDFIGEPYIVHAEVKGQGKIEGLRYGHAWIEDDENVYDYSNGRQIKMPKMIYYLIGDIRTDNPKKYMKYTFSEARKKMVDTGTYGSWDIDTLYEEGGGILYKEGDVRYSDGGTTIQESDTNVQEVLKKPKSLKEIANEHKVSIKYLKEQLEIGTEHEKEHLKSENKDSTVSEIIALHHLAERPNYYEVLAELQFKDGGELDEVFENTLVEVGIIDFLASEKMEAKQVLMCSDSRIFKSMICKTKIEIAQKRGEETENPEEKNAWQACQNIWESCYDDVLQNNKVSNFKDGGTPCGCGTMYKRGGLAYGNSHDKGGMPLKVQSTGQNIEIEGGEGVVNKRSMQIDKKLEFEGKKMTACEVVSKINEMGGGVKFKCSDVANIIAEDGNF